jgi:hypothetical protein
VFLEFNKTRREVKFGVRGLTPSFSSRVLG